MRTCEQDNCNEKHYAKGRCRLHYLQKSRRTAWVSKTGLPEEKYGKITKDPNYSHKRNLQREYGISMATYDAMLDRQGGVCAICGRDNGSKRLAVDHNHETGAVRGLLCTPCNISLGSMEDSIERLKKAIAYLEQHKH